MLTRSIGRTVSPSLPRTSTLSGVQANRLFQSQAVGAANRFQVPSLHQYGLMSRCAYLHNIPHATNDPREILLSNHWEIKEFSHGTQKSGYVGCIFVNHNTKQVVVAHAGTVPGRYQTLLADLRGIIQGHADPLVVDSLLQVNDKDIAELIKKGYHVSFTGHSLGGFLSEMSVFACHRGLVIKNPQVSAVTFDSPGSLEVMEAWQSNVQGQRVDLDRLNVTSFLSSPNLVNTMYRHPGAVYRLIRDLGNNDGVLNSVSYLLASHNLNEMVNLFDPTTGLPKEDAYCMMHDWPVADYSDVLDIPRHPVSGTADLIVTKSLGLLFTMLEKVSGKSKDGPVITLGGGRSIKLLGRELGSGEDKVYHQVFDNTSAAGLTTLIETHYHATTASATPINRSMSRINFPPALYEFLCVYNKCKADPIYQEFLKQNKINDLDLPDYKIEDGVIVTLSEDVFELRNKAWHLLSEHGSLIEDHEGYYDRFYKSIVDKLQKDMNEQGHISSTLQKKLDELQLQLEQRKETVGGRTIVTTSVIAKKSGARVFQVLGKAAYSPERQEERERMASIMKPGDTFIADSTVLEAEDAHATVLPNEPLDPTVQELLKSSGGLGGDGKKL